MNPALEVDPADVAGGPDDAKLQLVRRASSDGGVQRAVYTHTVVRVDPFEKALVRRVELARRVAEYLGYHVRAQALVGKHVPIQQTHTPCLGSESEPLLSLLQLLLGPSAVDELADPAPEEADGVEQLFVRVQDLAAQELDDPVWSTTPGNGKGEGAPQPTLRRIGMPTEPLILWRIPGPHGSVLCPGATRQALATHETRPQARLRGTSRGGIRPVPDLDAAQCLLSGHPECGHLPAEVLAERFQDVRGDILDATVFSQHAIDGMVDYKVLATRLLLPPTVRQRAGEPPARVEKTLEAFSRFLGLVTGSVLARDSASSLSSRSTSALRISVDQAVQSDF